MYSASSFFIEILWTIQLKHIVK